MMWHSPRVHRATRSRTPLCTPLRGPSRLPCAPPLSMPVWRDWRIIGVFAVLTVLSACTVVPQTPSTDQAGNALLHRERLLHANPEEAARLLNEARARVATQPSLTNRVELALLLLLPGSHAGQRLEAQTLLKGCDTPLPDDSSTALCGFTLARLGDATTQSESIARVA